MSDGDNKATAILLPSAAVAVYSRDAETLEAASGLANDWRFARVRAQAVEGDVETAVQVYREQASPELLIVQTDSIDDAFTAKLEELAGSCSEGTAAIVIGPVNDVYLYRRLIEMGVSDYLVRPMTTDILAEVIAKILIEKVGVSDSCLIAVAGAKGGVGTSAITQAMAWGIADILDQKTFLMDVSGGLSTLGVGMGFEPTTTLSEVARACDAGEEDSIKRMIHRASEKLSVLTSGSDALLDRSIQPEQLERILTMFMVKYPVLLVDLSACSAGLRNAVIARANKIILVSTPLLPSLRLARSLIQEMRELRGGRADEISMVLNMSGFAPGEEVPKGDIEKAMDFKPSASIPFSPKLFVGSESQGRKIAAQPDGLAIVQNMLLPLLKGLVSGEAESVAPEQETGKAAGLFGELMTKIKAKS